MHIYDRSARSLWELSEAATSDWKKHKNTDSGDRIISKLSPLRTDMIDQMSNIEESWKDTIDSKEWRHGYDVKEKKLLVRAIQDSRSWGREALKKFEGFKEELSVWKQREREAALQSENTQIKAKLLTISNNLLQRYSVAQCGGSHH